MEKSKHENDKSSCCSSSLAVMLGAGSAVAGENPTTGKFGLGYQGIVGGEPVKLQGVSGRYWFNENVGGELNVFYGRAEFEVNGEQAFDGDLLIGTAKLMYSPIVKENSRFYVGLEGGIGGVNAKDSFGDDIGDMSVYVLSPLFGGEFNFSEFPELGLNFEVGYKFHSVNVDTNSNVEIDANLDGTFVSLGAHYYILSARRFLVLCFREPCANKKSLTVPDRAFLLSFPCSRHLPGVVFSFGKSVIYFKIHCTHSSIHLAYVV